MANAEASSNEPFISHREYIHWIPGDPSEPTSTLVLTSSHRHFIDIRITKPTANEPDLPNEGGPFSRLQWAFAGTSCTTLIKPEHGTTTSLPSPVHHCVWTHWIDSHAAPYRDTEVRDEGDIFPQADGKSLEVGEMVNPATGKVQRYEECWADEEVGLVGKESRRMAVVLELSEKDARGREWAKGSVVRIGRWVQGIVKVVREERGEAGEVREVAEVSCERWMWDESKGWLRVVKIGRLWLPCAITWEEGLKVGREVRFGDWRWELKEVDSW
ncbi:Topoisomerase 1-associated factor 1 [Elsinoe australis]|uniref:Protein HRI1 n=1 Tax=Elsinoe australis TaxID=40998 RepID=A0A2P8A604_9PEZI|nr:Topoisomerase 1-associated factor 1 [Elsinoe australis]